jgi:ankyrin repeat protein
MYICGALDKDLIQNARDGNHVKVRDLLREGANVNARDVFGETSLLRAAFIGRLNVVRELLKHDHVDVNAKDGAGDTSLIIAVREGHVDVVIELLKHHKVDVNIKSKNDMACAPECSEQDNEDDSYGDGRWGTFHIDDDYDDDDSYDDEDEDDEDPSLYEDDNAQDVDGDTALSMAICDGHLEVVIALLKHDNTDVNAKIKHGKNGPRTGMHS